MSGPMVGFFDGPRPPARGKSKYMPAISPALAPWSQMLDRLVATFDLDHYPEGALTAALAGFEAENGRPADPANSDDWAEVADLATSAGGWSA